MAKELSDYILYYSPYCPFCIRVLNVIEKLNLKLQLRDTANPTYQEELAKGGGRTTVPCLKHPSGTWQYESVDIAQFLETL